MRSVSSQVSPISVQGQAWPAGLSSVDSLGTENPWSGKRYWNDTGGHMRASDDGAHAGRVSPKSSCSLKLHVPCPLDTAQPQLPLLLFPLSGFKKEEENGAEEETGRRVVGWRVSDSSLLVFIHTSSFAPCPLLFQSWVLQVPSPFCWPSTVGRWYKTLCSICKTDVCTTGSKGFPRSPENCSPGRRGWVSLAEHSLPSLNSTTEDIQ